MKKRVEKERANFNIVSPHLKFVIFHLSEVLILWYG
jgi:hypothetical protein